jgi:hypothetical protein
VKSPAALAQKAAGERCQHGANSSPVTGRAERAPAVATNSTFEQAVPQTSGDPTMVITEFGYLFLALSALAVVLFCWLTSASLWSARRDK